MTQSKTPITPTSGMPITEHPQYMAAMDAFRKERDIGKWVSVEGNGYVWPMFAMYWWPAWLQSRSTLEAEVEKLRAAIKAAGFSVMQTSGDWSIHDVSELGKREQERTREVIEQNIDLREYIDHKSTCRIKLMDGSECTCGLEELLK